MIAVQPTSDDHSRDVPTPAEQLPEERLGGGFIAAALHEQIETSPRLIHRPTQVMLLAVDREEDSGQVPRVGWPGTSAPLIDTR